jgi:multidrug efflux pump subunit AcrA (membrane-fusion protein)
LPIGQPHDSLIIPEEALGTDQGKKFLYVVDDEDTAQYRTVTVGSAYDKGMRVVTEGLQPGERVVVNGLQRIVKSGQAVTPKPEPPKPEPPKAEAGRPDAAKSETAKPVPAKGESLGK